MTTEAIKEEMILIECEFIKLKLFFLVRGKDGRRKNCKVNKNMTSLYLKKVVLLGELQWSQKEVLMTWLPK